MSLYNRKIMPWRRLGKGQTWGVPHVFFIHKSSDMGHKLKSTWNSRKI